MTFRSVVPSALLTVPVVVYRAPGLSGNHLLSIVGDAWKALRSKLMEDPGPHSSVALPVAVGDALPVPDAGPAGDAGSEDRVEADGASAEFGTPHATADIAKSIVKAEPNIVARLFGWNISVAFRVGNMDPSNCARPTM